MIQATAGPTVPEGSLSPRLSHHLRAGRQIHPPNARSSSIGLWHPQAPLGTGHDSPSTERVTAEIALQARSAVRDGWPCPDAARDMNPRRCGPPVGRLNSMGSRQDYPSQIGHFPVTVALRSCPQRRQSPQSTIGSVALKFPFSSNVIIMSVVPSDKRGAHEGLRHTQTSGSTSRAKEDEATEDETRSHRTASSLKPFSQ